MSVSVICQNNFINTYIYKYGYIYSRYEEYKYICITCLIKYVSKENRVSLEDILTQYNFVIKDENEYRIVSLNNDLEFTCKQCENTYKSYYHYSLNYHIPHSLPKKIYIIV